MATPPRPRPSIYQRAKRVVDRQLSLLTKAASVPLAVIEHELAPVPQDAVCPMPVNQQMVPTTFIQSYEEVFKEVTPNFQLVIHQLKDVKVAWHGTVVKGLRVFVPSLPQPWFESEFGGFFLLRQIQCRRDAELEKGPVGLAFDSWSGNYFHWIAEVLPRLALLRKYQPNALVLLPGPKPADYIVKTVKALGFDKTYIIEPGTLIHVHDLWMPVRPGRHGFMVPSLTLEVRTAIILSMMNSLDPAKRAKRRVYVSRNRQQWRHLTNEPEVLAVLQRYGFETVYFEEMSFEEQVRTMYEAKIFIGIHGANMTNVLFMNAGTHAIEMLSETYVNPSYLSMANSVGVNYSVVPSKSGSPENVEHNYADITVDPALVEHVVKSLCINNVGE